MVFVSQNLALIIFAIIITVSALIAWWMGSYANYDKGNFHTFIAILAGLGVFITFLFYMNVILLQGQQQELAAVQELARINDSVLNSVLDGIRQASNVIPNFVLSITPLTNTVCCVGTTGGTGGTGPDVCIIPVETDPVNPQTCTTKMVLSYRIFALWQDVIVSNKFINYNATAYVSNFLQRANSPQLYAQWTVGKIDFSPDTQAFGDLLFEYGLPITIQTPTEYVAVAEKLIADPRYHAIFNT